jgi:hypothetical protein
MIEIASVTSTHLIDGVFIGVNVGSRSFETISFLAKRLETLNKRFCCSNYCENYISRFFFYEKLACKYYA